MFSCLALSIGFFHEPVEAYGSAMTSSPLEVDRHSSLSYIRLVFVRCRGNGAGCEPGQADPPGSDRISLMVVGRHAPPLRMSVRVLKSVASLSSTGVDGSCLDLAGNNESQHGGATPTFILEFTKSLRVMIKEAACRPYCRCGTNSGDR